MSARFSLRYFVGLFLAFVITLVFAGFAAAAPPVPLPTFAEVVDATAVGTPLLAPAPLAVPKGTISKLVAALKAKMGWGDDQDAEAQAIVEESFVEQETAPVQTTPAPATPSTQPVTPPSDQMPAWAQAMQAKLDAVTDAMTKQEQRAEAAEKALADQQKTERSAKITEALDKAVKEGRIETAKRDEWQKRLEADYDGMSAVLDELPANPALAKSQGAQGSDASKPTAPATPSAPTQEGYQAAREGAISAFRTSAAQA